VGKDNDVPVGPGRGSGAGSLVAWSLKITDLDPLRWGLLFERFLNPERVSMPDFDIDFCQDKRDRVIRYVRDEYGHDRVAAIITSASCRRARCCATSAACSACPTARSTASASWCPTTRPIRSRSPRRCERAAPQGAVRGDEEIKRLIDLALQLEGLYRNASTHAAGVVIGDRPLDSWCRCSAIPTTANRCRPPSST
jgi:DNA polymerase-3 subunit alpha